MKKSIILNLLLLFLLKTMSQNPTWVGATSSNRLCPSPTNTRIGIGTNNPSAELHIIDNGAGYNWNQLTLQSSRSAGLTLINNLNTVWEIQNTYSTSSIIFFNRTNGLYAFTILQNGNVGIGNNQPTSKLDVNGQIKALSIQVSNELSVNNTIKVGNNSLYIENNKIYLNQEVTSPLYIQSETFNTNTIINHTNSGYVGIGTDNPQRKLHVKSVHSLLPKPPGQLPINLFNATNSSSNNEESDAYLPINTPFDSTLIGIPQNVLDSITNIEQYAGSLRLEVESPIGSSIWDIRPYTTGINPVKSNLKFVDALNNHTPMVITADGYVGIGTIRPINKLHINNGHALISGNGSSLMFGDGMNNHYGGGDYGIEYIKPNQIDGNHGGLNFWKPFGSSQGQFTNFIMHLSNEGNVGIGTGKPNYKLDVNGIIRSRSEIIICSSDWCDFVFNSDYKLEPFQTRIHNIKKQKHLPWIMPEKQVIEQGVSVSETIKGVLQNVEEIYLYMEQMQERIKKLEEENHLLKQQIK